MSSNDAQTTQYLLNIYQPDGPPPAPEALQKIMQEMAAIERDLKATDCWVFSGGLHSPSSSTVVRAKDGDALMTDGPFAEGKEHIGGFIILKAANLDRALEWATRVSRASTLPIEVRPFQNSGGK